MKLLPMSFELLREVFHYGPDTGVLQWAVSPHIRSRILARQEVLGIVRDGYHQIKWRNRFYPTHRVIWKWMTGFDPPEGYLIDHRDRDPLNNRWMNLRLATPNQNAQNKSNDNPLRNVHFEPRTNRWCVRVRANGQRIHVGRFGSLEEAQEAAQACRKVHHGDFAT